MHAILQPLNSVMHEAGMLHTLHSLLHCMRQQNGVCTAYIPRADEDTEERLSQMSCIAPEWPLSARAIAAVQTQFRCLSSTGQLYCLSSTGLNLVCRYALGRPSHLQEHRIP